jgi:hypothetical protein
MLKEHQKYGNVHKKLSIQLNFVELNEYRSYLASKSLRTKY